MPLSFFYNSRGDVLKKDRYEQGFHYSRNRWETGCYHIFNDKNPENISIIETLDKAQDAIEPQETILMDIP